jgi:hypothetical protein
MAKTTDSLLLWPCRCSGGKPRWQDALCLLRWRISTRRAEQAVSTREEQLWKFRQKIQSHCFHWNLTHKHGYCQQANGMDHVCAFCQLTEEFDAILSQPEQTAELVAPVPEPILLHTKDGITTPVTAGSNHHAWVCWCGRKEPHRHRDNEPSAAGEK